MWAFVLNFNKPVNLLLLVIDIYTNENVMNNAG